MLPVQASELGGFLANHRFCRQPSGSPSSENTDGARFTKYIREAAGQANTIIVYTVDNVRVKCASYARTLSLFLMSSFAVARGGCRTTDCGCGKKGNSNGDDIASAIAWSLTVQLIHQIGRFDCCRCNGVCHSVL